MTETPQTQEREPSLRLWIDGSEYTDVTTHVLSLEIEERTDGASFLQLVLDMAPTGLPDSPTAAHDWDRLADGRFALLHSVTAELALGAHGEEPDQRTVLFHGYVTSVEAQFGEQRVPDTSLTLEATDPLCLLQLEERTVGHVGETDADTVRGIFESYGFGSDVGPTSPARSSDRGPLVQRTTDADFVRLLARRHGFEHYVERSTAAVAAGPAFGTEIVGHFHPPRVDVAAQPPLALMPRETPSLKSLKVRWESHHATVMLGAHIDERTRRLRLSRIATSRLTKMGQKTRADILNGRIRQVLTRRPETTATARQTAFVPYEQQELEELTWSAFQEADWLAEAHGVVDGQRYPAVLRARRPIELVGAGPILDGRWYVRVARHRWDRQGEVKRYEIDVELVRNALGAVA